MGCLASHHRRAVQESDSNGQLCLDVTIYMHGRFIFNTKAAATVSVRASANSISAQGAVPSGRRNQAGRILALQHSAYGSNRCSVPTRCDK